MTLIDFYVLPQDTREAQHHFACRLIEKAVRQGNRVMVVTNTLEETKDLDQTLWSFRPDAFVPHSQIEDTEKSSVPVLISHDTYGDGHHDVLVNLQRNVPKQFSRFHRLAEIVTQEEQALENSRKSYTYYKSRGYPINTHKIGK